MPRPFFHASSGNVRINPVNADPAYPDITLTVPANLDGMLLIAHLHARDVAGLPALDATPPAGWTTLQDSTVGEDLWYGCYRRIAAAEPASYTWTFNKGVWMAQGLFFVYGAINAAAPISGFNNATNGGTPTADQLGFASVMDGLDNTPFDWAKGTKWDVVTERQRAVGRGFIPGLEVDAVAMGGDWTGTLPAGTANWYTAMLFEPPTIGHSQGMIEGGSSGLLPGAGGLSLLRSGRGRGRRLLPPVASPV